MRAGWIRPSSMRRSSETRNFAAYRVEAEHHRLRRIVDDDIDTGGIFDGANITALAPNDFTLNSSEGSFTTEMAFSATKPPAGAESRTPFEPLIGLFLNLALDFLDFEASAQPDLQLATEL